MTKDEHTTEEKKDGKPGKPRLSEASYNTSRNMPLPEPKVDKLRRWKEEPKPKKGITLPRSMMGYQSGNGVQIPEIYNDSVEKEAGIKCSR